MDIKINNVGIIKDSKVCIDGLTVITGKNNAGKSTVGKCLYSVISSTNHIFEKYLYETTSFAYRSLVDNIRNIGLSILFRHLSNDEASRWPVLFSIYNDTFSKKIVSTEDIIDVLNEAESELQSLDYESMKKNSPLYIRRVDKALFDKQIEECLNSLDKTKNTIKSDADMKGFIRKKVFEYVSNEFNKQIQPVKDSNCVSQISIEDNGNMFFDARISKSFVEGNPYFLQSFSKCYLIDDVNVLNDMNGYYNYSRYRQNNDPDRFEDYLEDISHARFLLASITDSSDTFTRDFFEREFSSVLEVFNETFGDSIIRVNNNFYCQSDKLDIRNLATGSKLFAILKLLFENGKIDSNTLIVLDEPENHLHPEWQNLLAKFISILVKEKKCKFVITTHSPNLLLALNTMMIKYNIESESNFYFAEKNDDGFVMFKKDNDNLPEEHFIINKPYMDMQELFEELHK